MKKKIVGILVLMLLLGISIPPIVTISGKANNENHVMSNSEKFTAAYLKFSGVKGEADPSKMSAGVKLTIINIGDYMMRDIDWTFNMEGGTIIFGDGERGTIPVLDAGEEISFIFRPGHFIFQNADGQSPIGFGIVTLMATAKTSTVTAELTEDIFLIGPIIYFYLKQ
jgi:hypothetical protein